MNPYFKFLRRLQVGGRSNMYGAIPYLSAAFGCDRNEAFRIICDWLDQQTAASAAAVEQPSGHEPASPTRRRKASRGKAA
jgi:hypothetical protein